MATGATTVTIGDLDVDDVTITLSPPTVIAGHLRIDGELPERPRPAGRGRGGFGGGGGPGISVTLMPISTGSASAIMGGGGGRGAPAADGAFRLRAGAGEYRVTVNGLPAGAYLKEARIGGVDVLELPLSIPGQDGTLEVVVSTHGGEVRGAIVDARGVAAPSAQAVLVPNRARQRADLYKTIQAGPEGRFEIKGVPPGDYKLFAWESVDPFQWFDPEFMERSEDKGVPVQVSESSVANAEVKLIPFGGAR
jgi:hypothetical protein